MSRARIIAIAAAMAAVQPRAAAPQALPSTPLFRSGVHLDLVDVVVRDRRTGVLVRNLTKDDFEIDDNGAPQQIASFAAVDLPADRDVAGPAGVSDRVATNEGPQGRVILFFVDDWSLRFGATPYLRDELHRYVDHQMAASDQVAIWTVSDALPRQGFTSDRGRLDAIVDRLQGTAGVVSARPAPFLAALDELPTWGAIGALIRTLAPFSDERKVVVYLGSWASGIPLDDDAAYEQLLAEAAAANVAIYPVSVRGVTGHISLPLNIIAEQTGGVVAHRNDFDHVMARIEQDAGSYYLIGFAPSAPSAQSAASRLHHLRVKVNRPGVVVQARTRYMPFPSTPQQLSPAALAVAQIAAAPLPNRALPLKVTASCFNNTSRADTVLVTLRAQLPGNRFAGHTVEYAVDALDDRARIVDTASGTATIPATSTAPDLTLVSALRVKPGMSTIKAALRTDDGVAGSVFVDVDVPKLDVPLALSDIELTSAPAHALVIGEPPGFLTRHLPKAPVVDRSFAATDTVTIYGEVYSSRAASAPSAALLVKDAAGRVERRLDLPLDRATAAGVRLRMRYVTSIELEGLTPGPHTVEVIASDGANRTATRRVALAVTAGSATATTH